MYYYGGPFHFPYPPTHFPCAGYSSLSAPTLQQRHYCALPLPALSYHHMQRFRWTTAGDVLLTSTDHVSEETMQPGLVQTHSASVTIPDRTAFGVGVTLPDRVKLFFNVRGP